jgi:DNA-binding response OmpR family regulator
MTFAQASHEPGSTAGPDDLAGPVVSGLLVTAADLPTRGAVCDLLAALGQAVTVSPDGRAEPGWMDAELVVLALSGDPLDLWRVSDAVAITSPRPVPLIVLAGSGTHHSRAEVLALGATEYLPDPWSASDLLQRAQHFLRLVTAARRRHAPPPEAGITALDADRQVLLHGGREIPLTPTQFTIMDALMTEPGALVTREQLLQRLYPDVAEQWRDPLALTAHIYRLRHKIEEDPANPEVLTTVRGLGFRLGTDTSS